VSQKAAKNLVNSASSTVEWRYLTYLTKGQKRLSNTSWPGRSPHRKSVSIHRTFSGPFRYSKLSTVKTWITDIYRSTSLLVLIRIMSVRKSLRRGLDAYLNAAKHIEVAKAELWLSIQGRWILLSSHSVVYFFVNALYWTTLIQGSSVWRGFIRWFPLQCWWIPAGRPVTVRL